MPGSATDNASSKLQASALSLVGKVREDNQDSVRVCKADDPLNETYGWLYAIADGMGGYSHGGVASSLALQTFFDTFYGNQPKNIAQNMRRGVQDANLSVYQQAHRLGVGRMGTTLTAVDVVGSKLHIAHVGDSRAYLIRHGKVTCLTNDHTAVGELVRMRVISPDKVRGHAQRSVLNKCLGVEMIVQPDVTQTALLEGDVVILCTDGVWAVIQDDEFADLTTKASGLDTLNQTILDLAMERDSDDNVSVVSVYAESLVGEPAPAARSWGLSQFLRDRFVAKS